MGVTGARGDQALGIEEASSVDPCMKLRLALFGRNVRKIELINMDIFSPHGDFLISGIVPSNNVAHCPAVASCASLRFPNETYFASDMEMPGG